MWLNWCIWILMSSIFTVVYAPSVAAQVVPDNTLPLGERSQVSGNPNVQMTVEQGETVICFWYLLILGVVFLSGVSAFRYLLFQRVDERVHHEMAQELETFRELIANENRFLQDTIAHDSEDLDRLKEHP